MASVNIIIVLIVGSAVGALTGKAIGGLVSALYLAMIAGVLATIFAGIVRNTILTRIGMEDSSRIPGLVMIYSAVAIDRQIPVRMIIYSAIASLAGSAAAVQIANVSQVSSSV